MSFVDVKSDAFIGTSMINEETSSITWLTTKAGQ